MGTTFLNFLFGIHTDRLSTGFGFLYCQVLDLDVNWILNKICGSD